MLVDAILAPSGEGAPPVDVGGPVQHLGIAILAPSEEGAPPCLSRGFILKHRSTSETCGLPTRGLAI